MDKLSGSRCCQTWFIAFQLKPMAMGNQELDYKLPPLDNIQPQTEERNLKHSLSGSASIRSSHHPIHSFKTLSLPPDATFSPSGLQSTAKTFTSQIDNTRYLLHLEMGKGITWTPSKKTWTAPFNHNFTSSAWPGRSCFNFFVLISQTFITK